MDTKDQTEDITRLIQAYNGKFLSGIDFNRTFSKYDFVILTNEAEIFGKIQYKDGLNIDFNKYKLYNCHDYDDHYLLRNGIHFVERKNAHEYICEDDTLMFYIRKVTIPDNSIVYIRDGKFKTYELYLNPREPIDNDMYIKAVMSDYDILEYVPDAVKNKELCMNAVTNCGILLKFVPEHIKDKDMCMFAVKADGTAIKYVPSHILDKDICIAAVKNYGIVLKHVPLSIIDKHICMKAIKQNCYAIQYVPLSILDKNICLKAIKQYGSDAFEYIPVFILDKDICMEAVKYNYRLLRKISPLLLDKDICIEALKQNINMIEYLPENLKDKQIYSMVMNSDNVFAQKYVPFEMKIKLFPEIITKSWTNIIFMFLCFIWIGSFVTMLSFLNM